MAGVDKRLTDLTELSNPTDNAWIHIVEPTDISQNPSGSSYKVKKSNFGGLSDAPSDGEQYARKDGAWEAVSSGVLTTNTNITSSSLTTQDVAGFVAYINGLVSSFAVAANEIRTYTVTDTGQKFEILLRGRSFGGSEPDITTSDVLELERVKQLIYKDHISGTSVVNNPNSTDRYTKGVLIPANTFKVGDFIDIEASFEKVSGGTSEVYPKIHINTIDSLSGATVLSFTSIINISTVYAKIQRSLVIKSSTSTEIFHHGTSSFISYNSAATSALKNINWTTDKYFIFSVQNNGALDATWRISTVIITRN